MLSNGQSLKMSSEKKSRQPPDRRVHALKSAYFSSSQLVKALAPIFFSDAGAVKDSSFDSWNAIFSMISGPSPAKVIYFRWWHNLNALRSIHLTLLGITIFSIPAQLKHFFPITSKPSPNNTCFSSMQSEKVLFPSLFKPFAALRSTDCNF